MPDFESLEAKLEKWFGESSHELPASLRALVMSAFEPFSWDELSPDQRRSLTNQLDYKNDPATDTHQKYWFSFGVKRRELEAELEKWQLVAAPTATDLAQKESRIAQLKQELTHRNRLKTLLIRRNFPRYTKTGLTNAGLEKPEKLIGLPLVLSRLGERLRASQEEVAAWVFMTECDGGIRAYKPQSQPEEFQRFYFEPEMELDYKGLMVNCWFDEREITTFEPQERFISGAACLEVLKDLHDGSPSVFLSKLIDAGRITDLHPITGATIASSPTDFGLPKIETGLFSVDELEKIMIEAAVDTPELLRSLIQHKENENPSERKIRLTAWHEEELSKGKKGAIQRTAKREGVTRQTLSAILKR